MQNPPFVILNTATYEVEVGNRLDNRWKLPDDAILRGKTIVGIGIRGQDSGNTRKTITGKTLVSNTGLGVSFITLKQDAKAIIADTPCNTFVMDLKEGQLTPVRIPQFSPSTSYIECSDFNQLTNGQAYEIIFAYED